MIIYELICKQISHIRLQRMCGPLTHIIFSCCVWSLLFSYLVQKKADTRRGYYKLDNSRRIVVISGYGHISPSTNTGRLITIVYAIFGIPIFLILLADFGKMFTRGIKFLWAFVRRLYYTGSCRKVRRTAPVQVSKNNLHDHTKP